MAIGGFASSFVAIVADIEVDTRTGKIRVKHLYAANDCGLVINPNLVEQQMEGCLIQGVSRALVEEVKFSSKRVTSLDWASYPILRYKDAPDLTTILVNRPGVPVDGRRRADHGPGSGRDRERVLRRDRQADPDDADDARASSGGPRTHEPA